MPLILIVYDVIVYDVAEDVAYWLHMQPCLRAPGFLLRPQQKEVTVRLSRQNVVSEQAIEAFRRLKNEVVERARKAVLDV